MNDSPNYYAILPASVRYHPDLTEGEKLLYAEITALCNKTGECWATNKYFAELYHTSERTISRWISRLIELNLVRYRLIKDEGNRRILSIGIDTNVYTPIDTSVYHNNTSSEQPIETISNSGGKMSIVDDAMARFVETWNTKLCNYCPGIAKIAVFNEARRAKIRARLAEVAKLMKAQGIEKDLLTYFLRDIVYDRYMNSQFLRGEVPGRNGSGPFKMDINHIGRPEFFAKMVEYRYDDRDEYRR